MSANVSKELIEEATSLNAHSIKSLTALFAAAASLASIALFPSRELLVGWASLTSCAFAYIGLRNGYKAWSESYVVTPQIQDPVAAELVRRKREHRNFRHNEVSTRLWLQSKKQSK